MKKRGERVESGSVRRDASGWSVVGVHASHVNYLIAESSEPERKAGKGGARGSGGHLEESWRRACRGVERNGAVWSAAECKRLDASAAQAAHRMLNIKARLAGRTGRIGTDRDGSGRIGRPRRRCSGTLSGAARRDAVYAYAILHGRVICVSPAHRGQPGSASSCRLYISRTIFITLGH